MEGWGFGSDFPKSMSLLPEVFLERTATSQQSFLRSVVCLEFRFKAWGTVCGVAHSCFWCLGGGQGLGQCTF